MSRKNRTQLLSAGLAIVALTGASLVSTPASAHRQKQRHGRWARVTTTVFTSDPVVSNPPDTNVPDESVPDTTDPVVIVPDTTVVVDTTVPDPVVSTTDPVTIVEEAKPTTPPKKGPTTSTTTSTTVSTTVSTTTSTTTAPSVVVGSLNVVGNTVRRTADGKVIKLNGVNQYVVPAYLSPEGVVDEQMEAVTRWVRANTSSLLSTWAGYGWNTVRVPVNPAAANRMGESYWTDLTTFINQAGGAGFYVVLVPFMSFDDTGLGPFLTTVSTRTASLPNVMIETVNEPHPAIEAVQWSQRSMTLVTAIRSGGNRNPIQVSGDFWSWNFHWSQMASMLAVDPNLIAAVHRYAVSEPGVAPGGASDVTSAFHNSVTVPGASTFAVQVGEYGPWNGGFGVGGSFSANVTNWCTPMANEIANNAFVGVTGWMYLWDENSMVSGSAGGDWYSITSGAQAPVLNQWGRLHDSFF